MSEESRVIKTSKTAKSGIFLEESAASLIGDRRHFVVADNRGITLKGPISIVSTSESVRKGGLFVGLNDFLEMLPSTLVSPLPRNIPFPPVYMTATIAKDVAFFMAFLI